MSGFRPRAASSIGHVESGRTLWSVPDSTAAEVADGVYRTLTSGDRPEASAAANALTAATAWRRHP